MADYGHFGRISEDAKCDWRKGVKGKVSEAYVKEMMREVR